MGSTANRLKSGVREWYRQKQIPLDTPQLVALSGGADSMALLYILKELAHMSGRTADYLAAAYFNHNLRSSEELEREMDLIKETADGWKIPLVIGEAGPGELQESARREKRSLEDSAREARYRFLEETLSRGGKKYIVLAHHADDQAETMISRFFQGSGMAGLCGIEPVRGSRLRPLLAYPKEELVRCLTEESLPWSEDSTNRDSRILRNSLRDSLMPAIGRTFPGYESSLTLLAEKIARYDSCLSRRGREVAWIEGEGCFSIDRDDFLQLDPAVREYALFHVIDSLLRGMRLTGGKGRRLPYRFIRPLLERAVPARMNLSGHGIRIVLDKKSLILSLAR